MSYSSAVLMHRVGTVLLLSGLVAAGGCRTTTRAASPPPAVDQITATMRPGLTSPTVQSNDTRPGFQQEAPRSQAP